MGIDYLRSEVCRVGCSLFERGYVHATAGNISVRVPPEAGGGILITPTDACLGLLSSETLVWVDDAGVQRSGQRASKTFALHERVYATDPQAHCVLHTHSTHLVALTLQGVWAPDDILPPITPYYVMKVGHVPLIPYRRPGDPDSADLVAQRIANAASGGRPIRAVMLDRIGPLVWASQPSTAMAALEELEETARLWLISAARPKPLDDVQINDLCRNFGALW